MPTTPAHRPLAGAVAGAAIVGILLPTGVHLVPLGDGPAVLAWGVSLASAFALSARLGWRGATWSLAAAAITIAATAPDGGAVGSVGLALAFTGAAIGGAWRAERPRGAPVRADESAITDALTGLATRTFAQRVLEQGFALAGRGMSLSLVMFDVDGLGDYNDRHGRPAGDDVVRTVGRLLNGAVRRSDLAARFGGEEFLCILHNCREEGALAFVDRVRARLGTAELSGGPVTLSAGVAVFQFGLDAPDDLLVATEEALYAAKAAGRDCTRVASPSVPAQSPEQAEAAARARRTATTAV